jgi:hypothetical protein
MNSLETIWPALAVPEASVFPSISVRNISSAHYVTYQEDMNSKGSALRFDVVVSGYTDIRSHTILRKKVWADGI